MRRYIPVLTIAGSDSSGGAGIQADIKTMSAIGCYGMSAITALTAQNTVGVEAIEGVSPMMVKAQIDAVFADISPAAVKTGMLFSAPIVEAVAEALGHHCVSNLVVDPVMVSTSGKRLIADDAVEAMRRTLFPLLTLITPNRNESEALTGCNDPRRQAEELRRQGCANVLVKGGDSDAVDFKTDMLLTADGDWIELKADAVDTTNTHGTGCTLSSAIACYMAIGYSLPRAVEMGKLFVTRALRAGAKVATGKGHGPVNHFFSPRKLKIT
ncbi:bifunctional hydroxymethylpyrimidine kinase/phosphomethylpyrimidine kinase [Paramuribaculum intestinale]|uniref:bifunctional hydroxymethylpyrimidine kinase/phosphomethylpyrimidine kinase n=1 Tax=Paramuribaculum intestinale TaxID=2094151 RepID=UPI0025A9A07F|nr:bifunctional hydroxymethylpyrimidine kinase/phosphomethylpyrimidine kinase [Paramuribaculum intestinale]